MADNDLRQDSYNKLEQLPQIPYSIVSYLIDNNEDCWKLLYDNSADAWKIPNLTKTQKRNLIFNGTTPVTEKRVFLDTGQDSAFTEQVSILRISVVEFTPQNYVIGNTLVGIEVYCHYLVNTLSDYTIRTDAIIQSVISTINGASIPHAARLYFDSSHNPRSRLYTIGTAPFRGKAAILYTWNT